MMAFNPYITLLDTQAQSHLHKNNTHHRQVDIGGIQLQVDLPVDCGLAVLVEVLSHLRTHCSETAKLNVIPLTCVSH